jgi:salicylate hydroxylase
MLGTRVTAVAEHGAGARVVTEQGAELVADLVLGCDGIHSTVRSETVGDVPARFSGMCAYRAMVRVGDSDGADKAVRNWLGPGRHLVAYPVGRDAGLLNLVCVVPAPDWREESWVAPGDAGELRRHFQGWSPSVTALLDRITGPVYRWALYDREPLLSWTTSATALLGDACHPMLPFMAQGAAQAIEDAAVLAECLGNGELTAGLRRYEDARRPRASRIQTMSWQNNVIYHLPDGPDQRARDRAMRAGEAFALDAISWLFEDTPPAPRPDRAT